MYPRMLILLIAAIAAIPAIAEDHTFNSNGTEIHFTNDGTGDPVILIHGYTANGQLNWKMPGIVRMLEPNHRVIVPDVRAHGKSAIPADGKYGIEAVEDIRRLMDHLGIEKAQIVGYSMGGMITIKFATMYPQRVASAIVGGMGWVNPGSMGARGERYANVNHSMSETYDQFKELETTEAEMRRLSMPLRVIVGTEDHSQIERIERWKAITPDLDVVYVEGAEHVNCVFRPDFKSAVADFLDTHRQAQ